MRMISLSATNYTCEACSWYEFTLSTGWILADHPDLFRPPPEAHPERLLTFVENPGLDPTNNACEQVMRWVVMQRRTHQRLDSPDGRRIFSVLMTCLCTWKLQGRDPARGS